MDTETKIATAAAYAEAHGLVLPLTYKGARVGAVHRTPGILTAGTSRPAEACDACGQSIMEVHCFIDAAGKPFKVGHDCVRRYLPATAWKAAHAEHLRLNREKAAARNAKRREAQKAKDAIVRAELEAAIEANAAALATKPHPLAWRAAKGDTMLDWARWTLSNGGGRAWRETLEAIAAL